MNDHTERLHAADQELDAALRDIRAREDAGTLSVREAADERIRVLEAHLARVRALRTQ